jgi:hypothetical protein
MRRDQGEGRRQHLIQIHWMNLTSPAQPGKVTERGPLSGIDTLAVRVDRRAGRAGLVTSRIRNAHQVLSQVLAAGVEGGRIAATRRPECGCRASSAETCTS